jgi:UTP:GlnB (protein PII) uridylyltransferase
MHQAYDELLRQLAGHFLGHWKDQIALLGLGGYGRKEMSPYSDIDILFLRPEMRRRVFIEAFEACCTHVGARGSWAISMDR